MLRITTGDAGTGLAADMEQITQALSQLSAAGWIGLGSYHATLSNMEFAFNFVAFGSSNGFDYLNR